MDRKITVSIDEDVYEKFCLAMNLTKDEDESNDYYGKAIQRIPVWILKQTQYNHKIIRAYFAAVAATGRVTIDAMEHLCSDKNVPELYVPKSHGKVLEEDDGDTVTIWNEVEDTLVKYKTSFYN